MAAASRSLHIWQISSLCFGVMFNDSWKHAPCISQCGLWQGHRTVAILRVPWQPFNIRAPWPCFLRVWFFRTEWGPGFCIWGLVLGFVFSIRSHSLRRVQLYFAPVPAVFFPECLANQATAQRASGTDCALGFTAKPSQPLLLAIKKCWRFF